jgi:hypothetical protein
MHTPKEHSGGVVERSVGKPVPRGGFVTVVLVYTRRRISPVRAGHQR